MPVELVPRRRGNPDRREFVRDRVLSGYALVFLAVAVRLTVFRIFHHDGFAWGVDFRGGLWPAANDVLRGISPYLPADPHLLFALKSPFVWPPLMAVAAMPLAHLSFSVAVAIWNVATAGCVVGGLSILGVRDWRTYVLVLASYPMVDTLYTGQVDGVLFLLLSLAWRYRNDLAGPVALGAAIAAKLLAWPLLLWLVATRRTRGAALSAFVAISLLIGSWALIDFHGLLEYPALLVADAHAFERWIYSTSVVTVALHLGFTPTASTVLALGVGATVAVAAVVAARRSDEGWFSATLSAGLLVSPLLWTHYLLVLFIPLVIGRRRSKSIWVLALAPWVWDLTVSYPVRAAVMLGCTALLPFALGHGLRLPHPRRSASRDVLAGGTEVGPPEPKPA